MILTKEDEKKFVKLGIKSALSLAIHIPSSFEDYRIDTILKVDAFQVVDVTIESIYKTPNLLKLHLYAHNFAHPIEALFFKPKPYMSQQFIQGEQYFLYGKIECKQGVCSIIFPKKITQIGLIKPIYKSALRNDTMTKLIAKYVSVENLEAEKLDKASSEAILRLHVEPDILEEEKLYLLKKCELLDYMSQLQSKRKYFTCTKAKLTLLKPFIENLPFELTIDQKNTISDIKKDFAKNVASRRIVVGDVGSGKTMVILASAFMMKKERAILMVPTTILANQIFEEAQKYLIGMNISLQITSSKKVDLSEFDFIVGTHALLYRDLPKASLVMVDEQHRFGTAQRNLLEKLVSENENRAHFLQFSATPIPRTQAMILSSHVDVSLIKQTPFVKDISSKVIHKHDFSNLLTHIESEIDANNQIAIIYPLVEQSEAFAYQSISEAQEYWFKRFSDVYVTHGKDKEKESKLLEFREKGNVLIATTVIEVGISLPRLSTIIIVGAERLGLSSLHQLRGRVSRTGLKGYCFLYTNQEKSKRLEEFCSTKSGFDIAELDLKYRKSGDLLLGREQSGVAFKYADMSSDAHIVQEVIELLKS